MTGYGDARRRTDDFRAAAEVRAVNNRYFKLSCRLPEGFGSLESAVEKCVREYVERGTVSVTIRYRHAAGDDVYSLNAPLLQSYWKQLHDVSVSVHAPSPSDIGCLLQLPGAVSEAESENDPAACWPTIEEVLRESLERLQEFRRSEGEMMQNELAAQCTAISSGVNNVAERAPAVIRDYRERIVDRVRDLLKDHPAEIGENDVIREVSLYADRCDITEEITRLRCHIDQFTNVLNQKESQGRKLEFLGQEMFREINTIGSKANDVEIAHCVVEMKSSIEKIREILQNVE